MILQVVIYPFVLERPQRLVLVICDLVVIGVIRECGWIVGMVANRELSPVYVKCGSGDSNNGSGSNNLKM